jgi:hypothetical protein
MMHFGTAEGSIGPLEAIFRQLDFKPLVFGTFAEINTNVREFIETAVEYGVEHMGRTIAATTVDAVRMALRRRYRTQLAMAAWKGYGNLVMYRNKYVGTGTTGHNKARVRQEMIARGDALVTSRSLICLFGALHRIWAPYFHLISTFIL